MRITAFITDTTPGAVPGQLAGLELRHRQHARVEDRIRQAKAAGLANLPCHDFQSNAAWLEIVLAAADLVAWTQLIAFTDTPQLARCEINALRYRVPRRSPHHPRRPPTPPTHRRHLALGHRHRDRLAAPPRRLPLTARPPSQQPERQSGPWNARPPRRHGRVNHIPSPKSLSLSEFIVQRP